MFLRIMLTFAAMVFAAGQATAATVYWNYGIASAEVGYSTRLNVPIGYKISFVGIGPDDASLRVQRCFENATIAAGQFTWDPLDNQILDAPSVARRLAASGEPVSVAALTAAQRAEVAKTATMIARAERVFKREMEKCGSDASASAVLGMVTRLCMSYLAEDCQFRRAGDVSHKRYTR